ncbi:MAG: cytochrome c-type biogenesis protein [Pseudomonadota bacterium]|nr:cytochrome c-type biogenesis protein [Pseudomonadota bacterium]
MKLKIIFSIILLNVYFFVSSNEIVDESKIHKNIRCLVCQGQSISDSNSDFAITLKMVVKDLIKQGKTEEEIYSFLSEKYGDWILYKPKFNIQNFLLWVFPYLVLAIGGIIIVFLLKKRSKKI